MECRYYQRLDDGAVECLLCPHHCHIAKGKSGIVSDEYVKFRGGVVNVNMTSAAKVISGDTLKPACAFGSQ